MVVGWETSRAWPCASETLAPCALGLYAMAVRGALRHGGARKVVLSLFYLKFEHKVVKEKALSRPVLKQKCSR